MDDVGVVILNWNTEALLRRCLETVFASQGVTLRVIVVDNASKDGSAAMVRRSFPQAELIVSPVNGGYPYGNNLGLRALGFDGDATHGSAIPEVPRYALLLNPDTEVPPDALAGMTAFMDAHPSVGAAGPKLVLPDGTLDLACRRSFPSPTTAFYHYAGLARLFPRSPRFARYNLTYADPDQGIDVDSVVGAYMQVRRDAIARVGLLDEAFFMYGEDLDWAFRIKQAGWTVHYHPQVQVRHVKRAASRKNPRAQTEFYRAMLIFYRKHYRGSTAWPVHLLVLLGVLVKGGKAVWPEVRQPARRVG